MFKILDQNSFYFLKFADTRYVKSLLTNIWKQYNILKISLLFNKFTNFTANNSIILRIRNAKFSGYYFYMNTNIKRDFQICFSVPLGLARVKALDQNLPEFIKPELVSSKLSRTVKFFNLQGGGRKRFFFSIFEEPITKEVLYKQE